MNKAVLVGIIVLIGITGGVLASPLFYQTEVNEPLPVALEKIKPGLTLETFADMDDQERQPLVTKMSSELKEMIMNESSLIPKNVSEVTPDISADPVRNQTSPEIIRTGEFAGLAGHAAKGTAKIIQIDDEFFLRFENFEVTNGPDLRVYLTTGGDVHKGIHLEKLKGSRGDQNYTLENINLDLYDTVVIYCQPFGVYFGNATFR